MHGGDLMAEVLQTQGGRFLYTLCSGHLSPILVGCKQRGIHRHAGPRLSSPPTPWSGVTNTITAVKNEQVAQSPVVLIGDAPSEKRRPCRTPSALGRARDQSDLMYSMSALLSASLNSTP